MNVIRTGMRRLALSTAVLFAGTWMAAAQADDLPSAETLMDRYVEVTGGKEAYNKVKSRVVKGLFEFVGMDVSMDLTVYQTRPSYQYVVIESEALGKIEQGTDGKIAWESSAITGARLKEGAERTATLRGADMDSEVEWRRHYKDAKTVGQETVDGKECYKVELTPREGSIVTNFFDKQTGLVVRSLASLETPMGVVSIQTDMADYQEVDGLKIPHRTVQVINQAQQVQIIVKSVEHNVDIPRERFEPPDEVRALIAAGDSAQP